MELIIMILVPFPLGFLTKNRTAAYVAYIAVHTFVFTFQSLSLIIDWAGGSQDAFGPFPQADKGEVLAYGVVNLVIYIAGMGLVTLGNRLGAKRRLKTTQTAGLASAA